MSVTHNINSIYDLDGEFIEEICFPADYVEIRFAGPILRLLLHPIHVTSPSAAADFPGASARELLRATGGSLVAGVELARCHLLLQTSDGTSIHAKIDESDARGPESIQFVPWENGRLNVAAMAVW